MAIGSGLAGQIGIVAETTYGTAVTVSRFFEVQSTDMAYKPTIVQGGGLRAGTFAQPTNRRTFFGINGSIASNESPDAPATSSRPATRSG